MKLENFPLTANSIVLKFNCPKCGEVIVSHKLEVPYPNMYGKNHAESEKVLDDVVVCPKCNKEIPVDVFNAIDGGSVAVKDLKETDKLDVDYHDSEDPD
jgi:transcription elongation factor Elf1